jgi:hypothetical protein
MGTFAERANADYCLLFAYQGKQTSVFHFRLQQTNRSCCFSLIPFSVSGISDMDLEIWKHGDGDIDIGHGTWRNGDTET